MFVVKKRGLEYNKYECINKKKDLLKLNEVTALNIKYIEIDDLFTHNSAIFENKILLCKNLEFYACNTYINFIKHISSFSFLLHVFDFACSDHKTWKCYVLQNDRLTIVTETIHCKNKCLDYEHCYKCFVKYKLNALYYKHLSLQCYHRDYSIINKINKNVKHMTFSTMNAELRYNFNFGLKEIRILLSHKSSIVKSKRPNTQKKSIKIPFGVKCTLYKI